MLITSWKPDSIYRFELESHTYVTIPVRDVHYPRSIDYDATEDRIYWTSIFWTGGKITDSEIYSSYLNGTDLKIIRGLGQSTHFFCLFILKEIYVFLSRISLSTLLKMFLLFVLLCSFKL